ncbi:hypothetical protein, partial [Chromobacterium sp. ASV23]|uniref:hypothetical protein n=1 Tax=Chromobacterium sp. ASV23 TaxID=2795110 RepID=UPI001E4B95CD
PLPIFVYNHKTSVEYSSFKQLLIQNSTWESDGRVRFYGADQRLGSQVGKKIGTRIVTTGKSGYLIFGPYISMDNGKYSATITGAISEHAICNAKLDISVLGGAITIAQSQPISNEKTIFKCEFTLAEPCKDLEIRVWV